jgi:hypothetical protein
VGGFLEQYTHLTNGYDYYQLLTITDPDLAICGDSDSDEGSDLMDFARFQECYVGPVCDGSPCAPPAWTPSLSIQDCVMMDFDFDGDVDSPDYELFFGLLAAP